MVTVMYVKSLRVAGFKSFADPTILEFVSGVNVIVGPNGSGKSNISDALSWVLGSQAPSTLRGASMEDVIFAGSQGRPQQPMAEVRLTLDNTARVLPLDLNEVEIARYADRTGASEYRINGAPCRLLDIQELLSDTGVGRSIHTIVGQGNLDAVLQAKPEDRRVFIEEAAQVGKFRRRKDRALKKIERVEDNLTRLNDVLSELRRSIRPLKRQATAAEAFTELSGEHRELRQRLVAHDIRVLSDPNTAGDPQAEQHRIDLLDDELQSVRARLSTASAERERLVADAETARELAHRIARGADRLAGLGRLASERAATIEARLAAETEEGYRERIRLLENERERFSSETAALSEKARVARSKADALRQRSDQARAALDEGERALAEARASETSAAQALVRAEGSEAAGRATIGSIEARVNAVMEKRKVLEGTLREDVAALDKAEHEIRAIEADLDRLTEAAAAAEVAHDAAREEVRRLRDQLGASHAERAAAEARANTLDEVLEILSDIEAAKARLAETALQARSAAQLAGAGEEQARSILEAADQRVEQRWQEVARLDEELRKLDALMNGAAERLGGARRGHEQREIELSALDEEISRSREQLAAAETAAAEERAQLPQRRATLQEKQAEREAAETRVASARAASAEVVAEMRDAELEARGAEERSLGAQLRLEEAEGGIADARSALEGLADLRSNLEAQRARARAVAEASIVAASQAEGWAIDSERRALAARESAAEGERQVVSLRTRERELKDGLDDLVRKRNDAEVKRAEVRARIDSLCERAMEEWGLSREALDALEPFSDQDFPEVRVRVEKLDRQMKRMGVINPRAAEEYAELAERETFLVEQMEDLRSSKRDLMKVVDEVDQTIVEVFSQAYEDVAKEFAEVFTRLFPGGDGRLKLTNPNDMLNTGIEIEARPPGKNVRKLSLLSGGERSLVALAFLFSIFRSRPSPFYLLDEVEAALDDFNLQRFIQLVNELEENAQILIVTHQKRTMEAGDVLYGVSMGKDGVSKVVARKMEEVLA
jgi:chromosome segregation protein